MDVFEFEGLNRCQSVCGVEIHGRVVVVTQLAENQGTSVTNAWPVLADLIMQHYDLFSPEEEDVRWIEHYPPRPGHIESRQETWDEVHMVRDFNTHKMDPNRHPWTRLTEEEIQNLINPQDRSGTT